MTTEISDTIITYRPFREDDVPAAHALTHQLQRNHRAAPHALATALLRAPCRVAREQLRPERIVTALRRTHCINPASRAVETSTARPVVPTAFDVPRSSRSANR